MNLRADQCVISLAGRAETISHVEDVRPRDAGLCDECWLIGELPDGRWYCWSSDPNGSEAVVADEAAARKYWAGAAEAERTASHR